MENITAWIALGFTGIGMPTGAISFVFRMSIKPLKIVIENNTAAFHLVSQTIKEHTTQISDHEGRIIEIETTHDILDCKHNRRKGDKQ